MYFSSQEKQLCVVREIVSAEKDLRDETKEKLAMLSSTGRYSRGNFESPGDRLNTINELNSTGSLLASFDVTTERTEEELELSVMRSSRAPRMKRTSEGGYPNSENSKRYRKSREVNETKSQVFAKQKFILYLWSLSRTNWRCQVTSV